MEGGGENFRLHAFLVLYNIPNGIHSKYCKIILILIQEIKWNTVCRRYQRETANADGVVVHYLERLPAHLSITIQKVHHLGKYQGKSTTFLEAMHRVIGNVQ
jgi:hypothetical protein